MRADTKETLDKPIVGLYSWNGKIHQIRLTEEGRVLDGTSTHRSKEKSCPEKRRTWRQAREVRSLPKLQISPLPSGLGSLPLRLRPRQRIDVTDAAYRPWLLRRKQQNRTENIDRNLPCKERASTQCRCAARPRRSAHFSTQTTASINIGEA
jgi:hypothetical protein